MDRVGVCPPEAERAVERISPEIQEMSTLQLEQRAVAHGKCRRPGANPEAWFPVYGESANSDPVAREYAARVCGGCPVTGECLELAMRIRQSGWGVWGGLSVADRARARRVWLRRQAPVGGGRNAA